MRREILATVCWTAIAVGLCPTAAAQVNLPNRTRTIVVPVPVGTTVASARIHAQAAYLTSLGNLRVDTGAARILNEEARSMRMDNHLKWVETYFEGRQMWREYRKLERPDFLAKEARRQQVKKDLVQKYYQHAMNGDITKTLNWLLRELSGPTLAMQYLPQNDSLAGKGDQPLSQRDVSHIRLSDGGGGGKEVIFRAHDGEVLRTQWPPAFRAPEFEDARIEFDETRDEVLQQIAVLGPEDQLSFESRQMLMNAAGKLVDVLNAAYPRQRRLESTKIHLEFLTAERFAESLLRSTFRVLETNDQSLFDGSYSFEGQSVAELLQHMYQTGLVFASPETGDEGTYSRLFQSMRQIYVNLTPEEEIRKAVNQF